jgi:hypothetical protein
LCGAATTLLALNACSDEATRATKRRKPGGTFEVPTTAAVDLDAARAALAGNEFVFDVQGHFLEYRDLPASREGQDFWTGSRNVNAVRATRGRASRSITSSKRSSSAATPR